MQPNLSNSKNIVNEIKGKLPGIVCVSIALSCSRSLFDSNIRQIFQAIRPGKPHPVCPELENGV